MTATISAPAAQAAPAAGRRRTRVVPAPVPWLGALLGAVLLVGAYDLAPSSPGSPLVYAMFWLGLGAFLVPAALRLFSVAAPLWERRLLAAGLGAFTFLPKLLRSPEHPVLFDELLHWDQANRVIDAGRVFVPNSVVPAIEHYPGLHFVLAQLHHLTQWPLWTVALVVIGCAHTALTLGVFALAREVTGSPRTASVAVLVYALSPGFLFFNTQLTYQALALPLMVFALVAALKAVRGRYWGAWASLSLLLVLATGVTHHVTSFFLLIFLGTFAAAFVVQNLREGGSATRRRLIVTLFAVAVVFNGAWIGLQSWGVLTYVLPSPEELFAQLPFMGPEETSSSSDTASRKPFTGSVLPVYEVVAGILAPLVASFLAFVGALSLPRVSATPALRWGTAAIAALYPLSLPLVLSAKGQLWAHRAWPFLFIAVSVLIAVGLLALLDRSTPWGRFGRFPFSLLRWFSFLSRLSPRRLVAVVAAFLVVLGIGNVSTEVNDQYRFPGPWIAGSDARATTPEMLSAAAWLREEAGPGARIVADNDTTMHLIAYADAVSVQRFPTWDLTFNTASIKAEVFAMMESEQIEYLVVDTRMYSDVPIRGFWYIGHEPRAYVRSEPLPREAFERLEAAPWAVEVYSSENIHIFRLEPSKAPLEQSWESLKAAEAAAAGGDVTGSARGDARPSALGPRSSGGVSYDPPAFSEDLLESELVAGLVTHGYPGLGAV